MIATDAMILLAVLDQLEPMVIDDAQARRLRLISTLRAEVDTIKRRLLALDTMRVLAPEKCWVPEVIECERQKQRARLRQCRNQLTYLRFVL